MHVSLSHHRIKTQSFNYLPKEEVRNKNGDEPPMLNQHLLVPRSRRVQVPNSKLMFLVQFLSCSQKRQTSLLVSTNRWGQAVVFCNKSLVVTTESVEWISAFSKFGLNKGSHKYITESTQHRIWFRCICYALSAVNTFIKVEFDVGYSLAFYD